MSLAPEFEIAEQLLRADSQTLAGALQLSLPDARREVQLLLIRTLGVDLADLLAHPERVPEARASPRYMDMLARRLSGEPIAYVLSQREFYGLQFEITSAVLIPRPETELLIDVALERVPEQAELRALDLGTGSGCIAIALAKLRPQVRVIATDISKMALAVAARNAERHAVFNLELRAGAWFEPVVGTRFHVIISNPPYVPEADPHLRQGDLRFEPAVALSGGETGLDCLRHIIAQAPRHLMPGGWLLLEHGFDQGRQVMELLEQAGFKELVARADLAGIARLAAARWLEATP